MTLGGVDTYSQTLSGSNRWDEPFDLILADPDPRFAHGLASLLRMAGFEPKVFTNAEEAFGRASEQDADFIVLGYAGQDAFHFKGLRGMIEDAAGSRVIVLLPEGHESYEDLLRQCGASMVLSRGLSMRQIVQLIASQGEIRFLEEQNYRLRQMIDGRSSYEGLLGSSPPMRALYRLLDQIARTDAPVLVTGEEGTEREEVARAIHQKSSRTLHPVVTIDCAGGSGQPNGEFIFGPVGMGPYGSGPDAERSAFARAGKGSLVLARIETLQLQAQRRLLDFMHRPFFQNETPGSPQPLARLMATAGTDLLARVERGEFLRELFYRLNILQVRVPPMRERREDIPMLAQHYLRAMVRPEGGASVQGFSSQVMLHLFQHDWPGNLEELRQIVEGAAQAATGVQIEPQDLPEAFCKATQPPAELTRAQRLDVSLKEAKRRFEEEYFKGLLRRTHGNMTMASRLSKVGRPYLYKKVREYDIEPEQFR